MSEYRLPEGEGVIPPAPEGFEPMENFVQLPPVPAGFEEVQLPPVPEGFVDATSEREKAVAKAKADAAMGFWQRLGQQGHDIAQQRLLSPISGALRGEQNLEELWRPQYEAAKSMTPEFYAYPDPSLPVGLAGPGPLALIPPRPSYELGDRAHLDPTTVMDAYLWVKDHPGLTPQAKEEELGRLRALPGFQVAWDEAQREAVQPSLSPPQGFKQTAADAVAGLAAFGVEAGLIRKVTVPLLGERWGTLLAWELAQSRGAQPGEGASMAATLEMINALPIAGRAGWIAKKFAESGFFAGSAALQGGTATDVMLQGLIPWVMSAPGARKEWRRLAAEARTREQQVAFLDRMMKEREAKQKELAELLAKAEMATKAQVEVEKAQEAQAEKTEKAQGVPAKASEELVDATKAVEGEVGGGEPPWTTAIKADVEGKGAEKATSGGVVQAQERLVPLTPAEPASASPDTAVAGKATVASPGSAEPVEAVPAARSAVDPAIWALEPQVRAQAREFVRAGKGAGAEVDDLVNGALIRLAERGIDTTDAVATKKGIVAALTAVASKEEGRHVLRRPVVDPETGEVTKKPVAVYERGEGMGERVGSVEQRAVVEETPDEIAARREVPSAKRQAAIDEVMALVRQGDVEGARAVVEREGLTLEDMRPTATVTEGASLAPSERLTRMLEGMRMLSRAEVETSKDNLRIEALAKSEGIDVEWAESDRFSGLHVGPGKVILEHRGTLAQKVGVLAHEMWVHDLRVRHPNLYAKVDAYVRKMPELLEDAGREYLRRIGMGEAEQRARLKELLATDEGVAMVVQEAAQHPAFWRGVKEKAPGLWARAYNVVRDIIRRVGEQLGFLGRDPQTSAEIARELGRRFGPLFDEAQRLNLENAAKWGKWKAEHGMAAEPKAAPPSLTPEQRAADAKVQWLKGELAAALGLKSFGKISKASQAKIDADPKLTALAKALEAARAERTRLGMTATQAAELRRAEESSTPSPSTSPPKVSEVQAVVAAEARWLGERSPELALAVVAADLRPDGTFAHPERTLKKLRAIRPYFAHRDAVVKKMPDAVRAVFEAEELASHDLMGKKFTLPSRLWSARFFFGELERRTGLPVTAVMERFVVNRQQLQAESLARQEAGIALAKRHGRSYKSLRADKGLTRRVQELLEGKKVENPTALEMEYAALVRKFYTSREEGVLVARARTYLDHDMAPAGADKADLALLKHLELKYSGEELDREIVKALTGKPGWLVAKDYAFREGVLSSHQAWWSRERTGLETAVQGGSNLHSRNASADAYLQRPDWALMDHFSKMDYVDKSINKARHVRPMLHALDAMVDVMHDRIRAETTDGNHAHQQELGKRLAQTMNLVADELLGANVNRHPLTQSLGRMVGRTFSASFISQWAAIQNFLNTTTEPDLRLAGWKGRLVFTQRQLAKLSPEAQRYYHDYVDQSHQLQRESFEMAEAVAASPTDKALQRGMKGLNRAVAAINSTFNLADRWARTVSFGLRWQRVADAFKGLDPAEATPAQIEAAMRRGGLSELQPWQRAEAMAKWTEGGVTSLANYVADAHTSNVNFRYERYQRSPWEMGEVGRLATSVMAYPRSLAERMLLDGRAAIRATKAGEYGEVGRALGRLLVTYAGLNLIGLAEHVVKGETESQRDERERTGAWWYLNPFASNRGLVWMGGPVVGVARMVKDVVEATTDFLGAEDSELRSARRELAKAISVLARSQLPFYRQIVSSLNAWVLETKNSEGVDVQVLRRMLEAERLWKNVEPPPPPPLVEREWYDKVRMSIFGTSTGLDSLDAKRVGSQVVAMERAAAKWKWLESQGRGEETEARVAKETFERIARALTRRGLDIGGFQREVWKAEAEEAGEVEKLLSEKEEMPLELREELAEDALMEWAKEH